MSVESALRGGTDRPFGLIETMRYEPGLGCIRVERHLARMAASARHFSKVFDEAVAAEKIHSIKSDTALRVRLLLDENNQLTVTTHPFVPVPEGQTWTIAIATIKIDAGNSVLAHKTTLRDTYDAARAEYGTSVVDEVLLSNDKGHMCEGTITNLFVQKDRTLVTPPLEDGLLRGVLRQELLETGAATEQTVTREDLDDYPFYVGNSLRGLISARLMVI